MTTAVPLTRSRLRWAVTAVACAAAFTELLDASIIIVALAAVQADLRLSDTNLQWVVNAYVLTFGGFLLLAGRTADLFGRKRVLLAGLGLFTVASLLGGLARTGTWLILARAAQGLGAAIIASTTLAVLITEFTGPKERARAVGAWTASGVAGAGLGSLIGGLLTGLLSWHWVLLVNVPVGLLLLAGASAALTESRSRDRGGLDVAGAVTVTAGLVALVYGTVATVAHDWRSLHVIGPLAAGVALLGAFLLIERRAAAPVIPLDMFRLRTVATGNVVALLGTAASLPTFYLLSLTMQRVLGFSPLRVGLAFVPLSFCIIVGTFIASTLLPGSGPRRPLVAGALLGAAGLVWSSTIPPDGTYLADLLGPTILLGVGVGLITVPGTVVATTGVSEERAGRAAGLVNTAQQFGGALALAAAATAAAARTGEAGLLPGYAFAMLLCAAVFVATGAAAMFVPRRHDNANNPAG